MALISACKKGKQPEKALEMVQAMEQQRLVPNVRTRNALMSAFEAGN